MRKGRAGNGRRPRQATAGSTGGRSPMALAAFVAALAAATLSVAVAEPAAVEALPSPSPAELRNPEWIAEGRKKFVQTCAFCHGAEGQAGKTRSFRTREGWDPQLIHDTIVNGRVNGPNVMPSWQGSIPDELIWKLVAYIKSLSADAHLSAQK